MLRAAEGAIRASGEQPLRLMLIVGFASRGAPEWATAPSQIRTASHEHSALPPSSPSFRGSTASLDALKRGDKPTLASVPDGFDAVVLADLTRARPAKSEARRMLVFVARDGQRPAGAARALANSSRRTWR